MVAANIFSVGQKVDISGTTIGKGFAGAITLMWVGANFINVSIYAGDSIKMQLPLLGGDSVMHDWNYLLSTLGIFKWTPEVAGILSTTGFLVIVLGILLSCYFAWIERNEPSEKFVS